MPIVRNPRAISEEQVMPTHTPTEEGNIQICKKVVEKYHQTHSYYGGGIFECGDMANDVWNMLKTKGINAKISIGNVNKDNTTIFEYNHAWVLAEVSANKWLPLETTGGYSVSFAANPRYYGKHSFYTPKQFKEYLHLLTIYNDLLPKYNDAQTHCDQLLSQYNQTYNLKKDSLGFDLNRELIECNQIINYFKEVISRMMALLKY